MFRKEITGMEAYAGPVSRRFSQGIDRLSQFGLLFVFITGP